MPFPIGGIFAILNHVRMTSYQSQIPIRSEANQIQIYFHLVDLLPHTYDDSSWYKWCNIVRMSYWTTVTFKSKWRAVPSNTQFPFAL